MLVVREGECIVGLAPWYVDPSPLWGRVVKQLGSGEVCSDYQTLLAAPGCEREVAAAVAQYLRVELRNQWDRLDLDGVVVGDAALTALVDELHLHGAPIERRRGPSCWRVALPATFDDYLALCSKSHRKQLRRLERNVLDTDRAVWHTVRSIDDFAIAWPIFVDLHQRRRRSLGEAGCFQSPCFQAFHEEMARGLLARGLLRLHWLELDGTPIAAEYHLQSGGVVYGYQSGVDPQRLDEEPGRLAGIAVIRQAISEGLATYDLLRGDEPYKAHWRALPTPTEQITVVNGRRRSRARHAVHQLLRRVKHKLFGPPPPAHVTEAATSAIHDAEVSTPATFETTR
ncbi:MAG: GNAT family N-acetyltransferase [Pirellulales bacterium]